MVRVMIDIKKYNKLPQLLISAALISTSLTGCGVLEKWSKEWPLASERDAYQYPKEANNIPVDSWSTPPQTHAQPHMPNMAPAQGLKPTSVAAQMNEPLGTEEIRERFNIMEQQIAVMRQDMERIAPLLQRLAMMETSMRDLSSALNAAHPAPATMQQMPEKQMHNTVQKPNMAHAPHHGAPTGQPMATNTLQPNLAPMGMPAPSHQGSIMPMPHSVQNATHAPSYTQAKPMPVKHTPKKASPSNSGTTVKGIRFGKYKGRDRVVLDLSKNADFRYDLDNNEKLLIVELPKASWSTQMAKQIKNSSAIASYTAQPGINGGTQLIFSLKKAVRVSQARPLPPNSQYGHRIFMDIE